MLNSVIPEHAIKQFPPARHSLILLKGETVPRLLHPVVALKQIRAHFEQPLFIGIKIGQSTLQPIDFVQKFGHEFSLIAPRRSHRFDTLVFSNPEMSLKDEGNR